MTLSSRRVYNIVTNMKVPGMVKLLVRDGIFTPQCIVFWGCLQPDSVQVGSTYYLSVFSTAAVKSAGLPKKKVAGSDQKHFASYGAVAISFSTSAEFALLKGTECDLLQEVPPHEATISPSAALLSPVGFASVLLDVTGIVKMCVGRRDRSGHPMCEVALHDGVSSIRVCRHIASCRRSPSLA
jgi:hypothetical protein